MEDFLLSAKKSFSKMGWIFFIFSIAVTIIQSVALIPFWFDDSADINVQITVSTLMLYITGTLVLVLFSKSIPAVPIEKKKMSFIQLAKAFFMCYTLMILTNSAGLLLTSAIENLTGQAVVNPVEEMVTSMSLPVMFFATVVGAPIFEELFFRKFIIDRLVKYGEVLSLMVSGFMFGLFHGNLSQFPYAFALGAFFGYIYIRTGQIKYPMILHAIINFIGSIVSGSLLKLISSVDMPWLLEGSFTLASELPSAMIKEIMDNMDVLLIFLIYELAIILFIVIGAILWILNIKSIYFKGAEKQIPKGKGFSVAIFNKGMIAYIILWLIMIALATVPIF